MRRKVSKLPALGKYTLVICEKPDAARRVAEALASAAPELFKVGTVDAFRLEDTLGRNYVVCAASGHLFGVSDTVRNRRVYPVFDLEWFPLTSISSRPSMVARRIRAIETLAARAADFVNACDFDVEGETIGYNILRYACGGKEASALRARFSSLTREDVAKAFEDSALVPSGKMAVAGRLRHMVDFLWGVNLSRVLSESFRTSRGYRTLSVGRVQGPALNFVTQREIDVRTFVPSPYWTARGSFTKEGVAFEARYSVRKVHTQRAADEIKASCERMEGVVGRVSSTKVRERPPPPFNLADLQREAFKLFAYPPSRTLRTAERLYLAAMISYPRTTSQRLPRLDFGRLLSRIGSMPAYSEPAGKVLSRGVLLPRDGEGTDPAHPAIYPTGEAGKGPLRGEEWAIFDLVVRRFISCLGEDAVFEETSAEISVSGHRFLAEARSMLVPGWTGLMTVGRRREGTDSPVPALRTGERVRADSITTERRLEAPQPRYDQATLLEKMEREGIGTKSTRADVISTLIDRGYLEGKILVPSGLGFSLVEVLEEYCPQIISTELTRETEAQLGRIEDSGESGLDFFEGLLSTLLEQVREMRSHEAEIAEKMGVSAFSVAAPKQLALGRCPVCKEGRLVVVISPASRKRFVGCTNYSKGCSASAPLPQRGAIKATPRVCRSCGWPVVLVRGGRYPWRLCVNDRCPRKVNFFAMQDLQNRGKR